VWLGGGAERVATAEDGGAGDVSGIHCSLRRGGGVRGKRGRGAGVWNGVR